MTKYIHIHIHDTSSNNHHIKYIFSDVLSVFRPSFNFYRFTMFICNQSNWNFYTQQIQALFIDETCKN